MQRSERRPPHFSCLSLALLVLIPAASATAAMQGQDTGAMAIVVTDPDGRPMSEVLVTLSGPQGSRDGETGLDGVGRFRGLVAGTYEATFRRDGYRTIVRPELRISVTKTTTVRVSMELSAVEETILVPGASPLIDTANVTIGATISAEMIDLTPTGSGLWAGVLDRIPGLVSDYIDVGGAREGNFSTHRRITAHGSPTGQNIFNLNGTQTTALDHNPGVGGMFYSTRSFAEVAVSTGAHDIEIQTPGVVINMVSKSGGNTLRGAGRFSFSNESLVGNNITPDLEEAGVTHGNPNTLLRDLNLQVGGPIVRDKIWAFVDYWNFRTERLIEGVPSDQPDDTSLRNWTVNTTWRINADHQLSARYFYNNQFKGNYLASDWLPPESALVLDPSDAHVAQVHWQGVLSDESFAEVRLSYKWGLYVERGRTAQSSSPHPDYPAGQPFSYDYSTGLASGMPGEASSDHGVAQVVGNYSRYLAGETVAHDLKFGGGWLDTRQALAVAYPLGINQYTSDGAAVEVELYNTPQRDVASARRAESQLDVGRAWNLYLQDAITFKNRLLVSIGLRYDQSHSWVPAQRRLDSRWAGIIPEEENGALFSAAEIAEKPAPTPWKSLVPRISLIYDLSGNGRTALRASYNRYSMQQGTRLARWLNGNYPGSNGYEWNDASGDGLFQWGEQGELWWSWFPGVTLEVDPELESPIIEEITAGIDHELSRDIAVSGTFIYRDTKHVMEDINIGVPYGPVAERLGVPDSYTPVQWTDPGPDGIAGTADDGGPITLWNQDPATRGNDRLLLTNLDRWGLHAPVRYRGVEFVFRKRLSDNWQALASWTIGKSTSGLGRKGGAIAGIRSTSSFNDPNTDINNLGLTNDDRTHIVKVSGNYLIPEPIGVNIGLSLRYESGIPRSRWVRPPWGLLNQGAPLVAAVPRGEDTNPAAIGQRNDDVTIVDLRVEKQFGLPGRWGQVGVSLDAFNLLNENAVRNASQTSGRFFGTISSIVPPRMLRLGLYWVF